MRNCPRCGKDYSEHPAISRIDNETEICPACGTLEAFGDYFKNQSTVEQRIMTIQAGIEELQFKLEAITKELNEKRLEIGEVLMSLRSE